ncbi:Fic family protein [Candidatus Woesearchaeota archaeon]|nr:Fic family protein [Candidatus Woesearchaeota archaeon]
MAYTEIRKEKDRIKYYRVHTFRSKDKVSHLRKFLGSNLKRKELEMKEHEADAVLIDPLNNLLNKQERDSLDEIKQEHQSKHISTFENRYEAFISEFTYDSTGIEGNTLTLRETAGVLFEGATPAKSLREIYEVLNHKRAFDYILGYKGKINKKFICEIQKIVTENTLKPELLEQAGTFRIVPVFIRGADVTPPPPEIIGYEMKRLIIWYSKNKKTIHPLILATYFHSALEAIHPFVDGNGRTGRLLLNFILHNHGYPMVSVPRSQRLKYFDTLAKAQKGNLRPFVVFLLGLLKKAEKSI